MKTSATAKEVDRNSGFRNGSAVSLSGGQLRGVALSWSGKDYTIKTHFKGEKHHLKGRKNYLLGLSLDQLFIKSMTIPQLPRKELQKAVELQSAYHLPYPKETAELSQQLEPGKTCNKLLLLASEKFACGRPKAIFPAPLALLGVALQHKLVNEALVTLLLLPTEEGTVSLCLEGTTPVFMRTIPPEEGVATGLVLAAQAVYLQEERRSLQPQQIVLFSDDANLKQQLTNCSEAELKIVSPAELVGESIPANEAGEWLLPLGLALLPRVYKRARRWNLYCHPSRSKEATRKRLIALTMLLPLMLVGYYYEEFSYQRAKLEGIEGRLAALNGRYREVQRLEREVKGLNTFLLESGSAIDSGNLWIETLNLFSLLRPDGVTITALSGKLDGEIQLSGTAENFNQVSEYSNALLEEARLAEASLLYTQGDVKEGVTFQLRCRRVAEGG